MRWDRMASAGGRRKSACASHLVHAFISSCFELIWSVGQNYWKRCFTVLLRMFIAATWYLIYWMSTRWVGTYLRTNEIATISKLKKLGMRSKLDLFWRINNIVTNNIIFIHEYVGRKYRNFEKSKFITFPFPHLDKTFLSDCYENQNRNWNNLNFLTTIIGYRYI